MLAAGVAAGAIVTAIAARQIRQTPPSPPALRLAINWPDDLTWGGPSGPGLALSPDGTHLAYVAVTGKGSVQICVQDLRTDDVRVVTATDNPYNPFFSPDGSQIGFIANGRLWRAPVAGGTSFEIGSVDVNDRGVAWATDGYIYSGGGSGISRIPESGGSREQITTINRAAGEVAHRFPTVVPGGHGLLFTVFKGSLEQARIAAVDVATKRWHVVMDRTGHAPVYAATGHVVYLRTGVLMAAPFDASRLEVTGPSVPVMAGVRYNNGGAGQFSVSANGTLAYIPDFVTRPQADLVWVDRAGRVTPADVPHGPYGHFELSPDGTRVALEESPSPATQHIAVWDFGRHALTMVTRDAGVSEAPIWTADGSAILFASRPQLGALGRLFRQRADGAGTPAQVTSGPLAQVSGSGGEYPAWVSPDGSRILYFVSGTDHDGIGLLDVPTMKAQPLIASGRTPRISPDGRWLAYRMFESGIQELFVSPYPNVTSARWQISTGGATAPRWAGDGSELFYRGLGSNRAHVYAVKVAGNGFDGTRPQPLVDVPDSGIGDGLDEFDVARDGRFLLLKRLPQTPPIPHLIVNWFDQLARTAPPASK